MSNKQREKMKAMRALLPFVRAMVQGQIVLAALERGYCVKLEKPRKRKVRV